MCKGQCEHGFVMDSNRLKIKV